MWLYANNHYQLHVSPLKHIEITVQLGSKVLPLVFRLIMLTRAKNESIRIGAE